ncbi:putative ribosome biogenesis ATPase nvl [Yarrowia sp. C11]|nr:putative ribosome biogenesis ATPase nvl [Yarrowia sp. C11]KAG5364217.1 putative ribosome biogenesis ATPase nvl [Yarrowia sp. E02]
MAGKKPVKGRLQKQQEAKVYELTVDLLEEKCQADDTFCAKNLSNLEVFRYVQGRGGPTGRLGKQELGRHVDAAITLLRQEEESGMFGGNPENGLNGDAMDVEEDVDIAEPSSGPIFGAEKKEDTSTASTPAASTPVPDSNSMNKSVVGLWNTTPAAGTPAVSGAATPAEGDNEKKRKREKTKERTAKKQKEHKSELSISLEDLGGIEKVIEQITKSVLVPLTHPEVYKTTGLTMPRGVLLHGPPGCGKTVLANAIANKAQVPFMSISAPSVVSGMSGESEKKIREIFEEARAIAPCLLFIDEIDAVTPKREGGGRGMETRIVAQLLTCIDDLNPEKNDFRPVIVLGATNRPDAIDPALRRPGRFDEEIAMAVPDRKSRELILKAITRPLKLNDDIDFELLAMRTPGYVAADLKALVTAAGSMALERAFKQLVEKKEAGQETNDRIEEIKGEDAMDVEDVKTETIKEEDTATVSETAVSETTVTETAETKPSTVITLPNPPHTSVWVDFLRMFPNPLTASQLQNMVIALNDFLTAIPLIQPSSKREGFATVPDVSWEDVGALAQVRQELHMAIVQPIRQPDLFKMVGVDAPGGVLLWGPPGCGKTLLAKAVASETAANFISVRGPELLNKYVGESERAIRQVFERAALSSPCIIFFDEFDSLAPRRDDGGSEHSSRLVNTLLTELNGLTERRGVYVIAATNRPDIIDPAMVRPGRLDKTLFVGLPDENERFEILSKVCRKRPLAADVNLRTIVADSRCGNYSGADLTQLANEAGLMALRQQVFTLGAEVTHDHKAAPPSSIEITNHHFEEAFNKIRPSVTDADRLKYDALKLTW